MALETVIGVDGAGGDVVELFEKKKYRSLGVPQRIADAVRQALAVHPKVRFVVSGDEVTLKMAFGKLPDHVEILDCNPKHSAEKLARLMEEKRINGLYTMGNTRHVALAVYMVYRSNPELMNLVPDFDIPPLIAQLPKSGNSRQPVGFDHWYLLDAGAQPVLKKPEHYAVLAYFGSLFYRVQEPGVVLPRVGLLNIGQESNKGSGAMKQAYNSLQVMHNEGIMQFIGNVEPYTCMYDREKNTMIERRVDVAVASGDNGNIALKAISAGVEFLTDEVKREIRSSIRGKIAGMLLEPGFERIRRKKAASAGAVFAGTNIVKDHGSTIDPYYGLDKCITNAFNDEADEFIRRLNDTKHLFTSAYGSIQKVSNGI